MGEVLEEDVVSLKARIRQLEMEHSFMQRELDNLSEAAQRNESHIRYYLLTTWGFSVFLVLDHNLCPWLLISSLTRKWQANQSV
jgi:hypothetical protein